MSKNIYDMFNDRKEGLNLLIEGANMEDVEAYESLDVAIDELENIVRESTNEFIEFQAASYLEDLVLENMMYDNFDEEKISATMEATMGERLDGLAAKVKKQWERIRTWFVSTAKAIANYFVSGEKLVSANSGKIPAAMKRCTAKVKIYDYNDPGSALDRCYVLVNKVKDKGATGSKEGVLKAIGAEDRKDVAKVVKEVFGIKGEPGEKEINAIKPGLAMEYAGNKKAFLDAINKLKGQLDQDFKAVLAIIEKGEDKEKVGKQVEVFNFATSIKSAIINAEVACIKKGAGDMCAVIRKALAASGAGPAGAAEQKRREKASDAQAKSFERPNGFEIESFKANLESMMEDLEFVDED